MEKQVILVNEEDKPTGTMPKMEAHEKGLLHRAFSIFIFNNKGEMLLQQRAAEKYHSGGLWTNACCSHPVPGEETIQAAHRRLKEELGFDTPLEKTFDFIYKHEFENGLTEYEFDHVYAGCYEGELAADPAEVMATVYRSVSEIRSLLKKEPEKFSAWFKLAFPKMEAWWNSPVNSK
jgi:isopentenyl-diphosphate delta-isomerase